MSFLSSWWSAQPSEEKKDAGSEPAAEGSDPAAATESSKWMVGLESGAMSVMKKVKGYASSLGETAQVTMKKVSESTLIGDFQREQEKFEKEQRRQKDSAIPPWVGYNEEEKIKADILQLSADSRNVLREPPPGVQFQFDFTKSFPTAMAILKEDPRLQKLRFELVPKKISEQNFWCNYFYRVFLIKQSSQLATLSAADAKITLQERPTEDEKSAVEGTDSDTKSSQAPHSESFTAEPYTQSHPEEFASDAFHQGDEIINRESLKTELGQLGVASAPKDPVSDPSTWEDDLQTELKDLDLEGGELPENTETWEAELEQMLDMHSDVARS